MADVEMGEVSEGRKCYRGVASVSSPPALNSNILRTSCCVPRDLEALLATAT